MMSLPHTKDLSEIRRCMATGNAEVHGVGACASSDKALGIEPDPRTECQRLRQG